MAKPRGISPTLFQQAENRIFNIYPSVLPDISPKSGEKIWPPDVEHRGILRLIRSNNKSNFFITPSNELSLIPVFVKTHLFVLQDRIQYGDEFPFPLHPEIPGSESF